MSDHEQVFCPRCNSEFQCKAGSISLCQCTAVNLTVDESQYICDHYEECLCATCMLALKKEYNASKLEEKFNRISTLFNRDK